MSSSGGVSGCRLLSMASCMSLLSSVAVVGVWLGWGGAWQWWRWSSLRLLRIASWSSSSSSFCPDRFDDGLPLSPAPLPVPPLRKPKKKKLIQKFHSRIGL